MSTQLSLPKGVDSMSLPQKAIAVGILGVGAYYLVPFLIAVMVNLYIAAALAIPLIYIAYNPMLVWGVAKSLSQMSTNWIIGLSPLAAMDRYLDWVKNKHKSIQRAKNDVHASELGITQQINEKEKSYKSLMTKASIAQEKGNSIQADTYSLNAMSDKQFLEDLVPLRDDMIAKVKYLEELDQVFSANTQQLEYSIENTKTKYKLLTDVKKGMKSADDVIGGAGEANRMFKVALEQTNQRMNSMTASIQQYENNIKPMLADANFTKELRQGDARKLLEDFRKSNIQLNS